MVSIRTADPGDFWRIGLLWRDLMRQHRQFSPHFELADDAERRFADYLKEASERSDHRVFVACTPELVGFCICCFLPNNPIYRRPRVGYINDVYVDPRARRQGVGRALVEDAVQWLSAQNVGSVELYVAKDNHEGLRFWERVGARSYLVRMSMEPQCKKP